MQEDEHLLERRNSDFIEGQWQANDGIRRSFSRKQSKEEVLAAPTKLSGELKFLFFVMLMLQLLNSMDRGYIPGTLGSLSSELKLTGPEAGSLNSAFLLGMICAIPFFTWLGGKVDRPFTLLSFGFTIWIGATVMAGFTKTYLQLIACRVFVGIGDAVFAVIAVPFVDYNAPAKSRASWMALFLSLYPIGIALGTVMGGIMRSRPGYWRLGFFLEAAMLTPFVLAGYCVRFRQDLKKGKKEQIEDLSLEGVLETPRWNERMRASWTKLAPAITNPLTWLGSFAFAGLMGVSAGIGYWSVKYATEELRAVTSSAASGIGVAVVVGSIVGTVIGGKSLDFLGARQGGKSCALAFSLCSIASLISGPLLACAYVVNSLPVMLIFVILGMTALMVAGSTFALATMWTVTVQYRVVVSGMVSFIMNLCGTVPFPIIVGVILDDVKTVEHPFPHEVMLLTCSWMVWPVVLSGTVAFLAKRWGVGSNVDKE